MARRIDRIGERCPHRAVDERFTALAQLVADDFAFDLERLLVEAGEWVGDARCLEQQEIEGGVARTEFVIDGGIEIRRGIE